MTGLVVSPNIAVIDRDTDGNPVPTWKAHSFTYVPSGVGTDTVTDGTITWVRTYGYDNNGQKTSDSGWVKQ